MFKNNILLVGRLRILGQLYRILLWQRFERPGLPQVLHRSVVWAGTDQKLISTPFSCKDFTNSRTSWRAAMVDMVTL